MRPRPAAGARTRGGLVRLLLLLLSGLALATTAAVALVWVRERPLRDAEQALERGDVEAALQATAGFLARHPENSRCLALRARALVAAGSPGEALRLFDRIGPASGPDLHAMARAYLMTEQWSQALPLLVGYLQLQPDDPEGLYEITACRVQLGMLHEALETARRFAELPGHEARGYVFLGTIHSDLGNDNAAADAYLRVLRYDPEARNLQVSRHDFLLELAQALLATGQPAVAVEHVEACLAERRSAEAYVLLGDARQQLGQTELAERAWESSLELDRVNAPAREALARAALQRRDAPRALDWLAPLIALPEMKSSTAYQFQRVHTLLGDEQAAARWRERLEQLRAQEKRVSAIANVLTQTPYSFWARVIRAHQFAAAGNWAQAEAILRVLEREQPADPFFQELVAAVSKRGPLPPLDRLPVQQF